MAQPRRPARTGVLIAVLVLLVIGTSVAAITVALTGGLDGQYRPGQATALPPEQNGPRAVPLGRACLDVPAAIRGVVPTVAVRSNSGVFLDDTTRCTRTRLIGRGGAGTVRVSANGEWIGYGAGSAVSRTGRTVVSPLGLTIWSRGDRPTWAWSPTGATMAGVTVQGGVLVGTPGSSPRRLLPEGWGATELAFTGPDSLVVARGRSLWRVVVSSGRSTILWRGTAGPVSLGPTSPDWVVYWQQRYVSASSASDGAALFAISLRTRRPTMLAPSTIIAPVSATRCGDGVAVSVGAGRDTTAGKTITVFHAPTWQAQVVGPGVAPSWSADGSRLAYSTGPAGRVVGREQRAVTVVSLSSSVEPIVLFRGRPPATASSAESPLLTQDGDALAYIVTSAVAGTSPSDAQQFTGVLTVARLDGAGDTFGRPVAGVGGVTNFYGTYSWFEQVALIDR